MRMMLVGAGAVGESILKIMQWRDPQGEWLKYVLVCDYDKKRAEQVAEMLGGDNRFEVSEINATDREEMKRVIREHDIDFVMDAAPPFASNMIFDAAFETGCNYASMGTWSVPLDEPAYGPGIENSYAEPMTKYNFDRHEAWKEKGRMAVICLGIDPGVVNVFAKYAATELLDEIYETHVKDGGNLSVPGADPDDIMFGFNVWTVLDEVMNPNVEYDEEKGGFFVEKAFAGQEVFEMPEGVGLNTLVKVEHEEVVTMPRYLKQYGLKKATFKISLDENLITALKVLDKLGLRGIHPVQVGDVKIIPRDVVAACAPQPKDIGNEMVGKMLVGVHCIGQKDGGRKEYFLYQPFDNQESMKRFGSQAVTAQTGFGAALALELIGRGIWKDAGVFSPEYFDPKPYLELMKESGFEYVIKEWHS
ncbi:MAG: saccharopine dehydrogenase NADP-binding domain-containing protein [Eubacteriales bacterium]|nr:saccharopine dehydrogenase NADP-binding domain-containing protein [Eubacteriales bacterium]